ncbi:pyridoxal-phosphate dependent enzyme [Palaeococcus sp. (in: euryarchaeotes)]
MSLKLKTLLARFPRVELIGFQTPIQYLPNLSQRLGIELYVKRDDLTGIAIGGNKVRKLEYLLGDALSKGYDTVITTGAVHSNHAFVTALAAKKLGLNALLVLRGKKDAPVKGNYLLDKLMGIEVILVDAKSTYPVMEEVAEELKAKGKKAYIIPVGGASPVGTLGYVRAAAEIWEQETALGVEFDYVVHAAGSGGTFAGLTLGFNLMDSKTEVIGIDVGGLLKGLPEKVFNLIGETAGLIGCAHNLTENHIAAHLFEYGFGEYGRITKEVIETIRLVGAEEGIILDPIYTAKAFYGLMDLTRNGKIAPGSKVLFVHTGGMPGIFQYDEKVREFI